MGAFVIFRPATSVPSIVFPASWRADQVWVWPADLDGWTWSGEDPDRLLSADERTRAARFVFEKDRRRFVTGRAVLRTLLGRCLGLPAAGLSFRYGPQGKPMLADRDLWFNASASAGRALYALSLTRRVGADIEQVRDVAELASVADRVFSATEREWLGSRSGARQRNAFFRCWTRKEAVIKGLGTGLSTPLDRFDVGPGRCGLVRVSTAAALGERSHWIVRDIAVFPGFAAAVAAEAPGVRPVTLGLREERA
jgi:4'-phosphopantetheinyl transferase